MTIADDFDVFLFDLDGVTHLGEMPFDDPAHPLTEPRMGIVPCGRS